MTPIPESLRLAADIDATIGNVRTIVRPNDDGTVDEVVVYADGRCVFHLEQMDDDAYWFAVYPPGDDRYSFWLRRDKKRVTIVMEEEPMRERP